MSNNNLIDPKTRMEHLSIAYVHAIASYCGYGADKPAVDHDSIDITISSSAGRKPKLDIQLKSTGQFEAITDEFSFTLTVKNYNDLRVETINPRILVVFCMPKEQTEWIEHSRDFLKLKNCAYYVSLAGKPETDNKETINVKLLKSDIFSPENLINMMTNLSQGKTI